MNYNKRNSIAGKGRNTRAKSNLKTGRDYSREKTYQSSSKRKKYRAELNSEAKRRKVYGKRHRRGVDLSHKKDGSMVLEKRSRNRARNRGKK